MSIDLKTETQLYADLMAEIKIRTTFALATIDRLSECPAPDDAFVQAESTLLQTRFVCELIALAALAAHSKFGLTPNLLKEYRTGAVFRSLQEINPNCFPTPVALTRESGQPHFDVRPDQMDLTELNRVYEGCGRLLHRGVIKHILKDSGRSFDLEQVKEWLIRIADLLSQHTVLLLRHNIVLIVTMSAANGDVEVQHAEGLEPPAEPQT